MSRKLHWGILGCARIAERALIPALTESNNGILYGIASRDYNKAKQWVKQYKFHKAYPSYDELLRDPDIDAVYIPLPNHLHLEWTIRSANAGKHILCEKPMAMNATEVRQMIKETDRQDVLLMEAFMYRFHPQHEKVLKLIESGEIGDIRSAFFSFTFPYSGDEKNYRWSSLMGGGALLDVGCYTINAARLIIGAEPVSVYAREHIDPDRNIDLSCNGLLEFPNHVSASFVCSFESQFQNFYEVIGSKGKIIVSRAFIPKNREGLIDLILGDSEKAIIISPVNQYTRMVEHFNRCILQDRTPRYPADDAYYNMRVIDAVRKSSKSGKVVPLKPLERSL